MTASPGLSAGQILTAEIIDSLDLEPIAFTIAHPDPGITLDDADEKVRLYRCFLKICAWYPASPAVPAKEIDEVWRAHIVDTAKYAADSAAVFGHFGHCFPYFGLRGEHARWQAAYTRTRGLFRDHFDVDLPAGRAARTCYPGNGAVPLTALRPKRMRT
jgi:hypothetical protein